jgi:hypothetical protein
MSDDDDALIDYGSAPEIYADGIGDATFIGDNARLTFFSRRKINGELRRYVVAEIVQPVATLPPGLADYLRAKFSAAGSGEQEAPRVVN